MRQLVAQVFVDQLVVQLHPRTVLGVNHAAWQAKCARSS
jgi:hypothetical protein